VAHGQHTDNGVRLGAQRHAHEAAHMRRLHDVSRLREPAVSARIRDGNRLAALEHGRAHAFFPGQGFRCAEAAGDLIGPMGVVNGEGRDIGAADIGGQHHQPVEIRQRAAV
jgi:hypothetical protein